jgi:hypothetical protein
LNSIIIISFRHFENGFTIGEEDVYLISTVVSGYVVSKILHNPSLPPLIKATSCKVEQRLVQPRNQLVVMSSGSRRRYNPAAGKTKDSPSEGMSPLQSFVTGKFHTDAPAQSDIPTETPMNARDKHRNKFLKFLQSITVCVELLLISFGHFFI